MTNTVAAFISFIQVGGTQGGTIESWDTVVIGGGIAAMRAAIAAHDAGAHVLLISAEGLGDGAGNSTSSGIAAALDEMTPLSHRDDTIRSGAWICDQDIVSIRTAAAHDEVIQLEQWGVNFRRNQADSPLLEYAPGHSAPRVASTGDSTTREIQTILEEQCIRRNIARRGDWMPLSLAHGTAKIHGVVALDMQEGELVPIQTSTVIIADGGFEAAWDGNGTTGLGVSLAVDAGCSLKDLEFLAWTPLHIPQTELSLPLGLLSNGGSLKSSTGDNLSFDKTLTASEIAQQIGQNGVAVMLDARPVHTEAGPWYAGYGAAVQNRTGLDPATQLIPVNASIERTLGGLAVDEHGRVLHGDLNNWYTGLYAAGGSACSGMHGASAATGNMLLEDLLGAAESGTHAAGWSKQRQTANIQSVNTATDAAAAQFSALLATVDTTGGSSIGTITAKMQTAMSTAMAFDRDEQNLSTCSSTLTSLQKDASNVELQDGSTVMNTEYSDLIHLKGMLKLCSMAVCAATARTESRGSHQRSDHPDRDDETMLKHTFITSDLEQRWLALRKSSSGSWIVSPGE